MSATQSNNYWSATTYQGNLSNAWNVNFNNGNSNNNDKTNGNYVRCVRALPLPALNLFQKIILFELQNIHFCHFRPHIYECGLRGNPSSFLSFPWIRESRLNKKKENLDPRIREDDRKNTEIEKEKEKIRNGVGAFSVIPVKTGIQTRRKKKNLDSRIRGNDR